MCPLRLDARSHEAYAAAPRESQVLHEGRQEGGYEKEQGHEDMEEVERRGDSVARKWYEKEKLKPSVIAKRLGRDKSAMTRLLVKQTPRKKQGRKQLLSKADVDVLERRLDEMIVAANAEYHVTVGMLKKDTKTKASARTIQKAFHQRNIYVRKLREKPLLTAEDVAARFAFAKKYKDTPKSFWRNLAYIDGKHYTTYPTSKARSDAAQHRTWGA